MKKLKIILQCKYIYILLSIIIFIYILIGTRLIKHTSYLTGNKFEGVITNLTINDNKVSFILKSSENIKCDFYPKDSKDYSNLLGKKVLVSGEIKYPQNNTIPNNFNYKEYLYNNKIYLIMNVKNIEILKNENILYKIKQLIIKKINNYDNHTQEYLKLFILGDKSLLDNDLYNTYRENGIWHLFAISGMHINLLIMCIEILLKKFKFKDIILIIILLYFMFLTNFSASVQRVVIFYIINLLLKKIKISLPNTETLFFTGFIILLINPYMIYNIGFIYSFVVTYSIMLFHKKLNGNYFIKLLKISLISFIVCLPININLNYEINILSIILNLIYVPFISLIFFPTIILIYIIPIFTPIINVLIYILELSNNLFSNYKLNIIIPKMSFIFICFYYGILYLYYKKQNIKLFAFIFLIIFLNKIIPMLDSNYYIFYLDVNQGDSNILVTPYKKNIIMIDTGGIINTNYKLTDNTIKFLKSMGIIKINYLILTHGDYDHMGEAINLVNNFKVEQIIFNCGPHNDLEKELIKVLDKKKIKYKSCINEFNLDKTKFYLLQTYIFDNENDNSNVLYFEFNKYKFLLMGDASSTTEKEIMNKYNLPNVDVLKVGHHGSKTSSSKEFVDEIKPKYSVISVGKNNRYGHPNKEVLDNLKDSKIYRTDKDGSIMFKINNNKLKIEICSP